MGPESSMLNWNQDLGAVVLNRVWGKRICAWERLPGIGLHWPWGAIAISGAEHFLRATDRLLKAEALPVLSAFGDQLEENLQCVRVRMLDLCYSKTSAASRPTTFSQKSHKTIQKKQHPHPPRPPPKKTEKFWGSGKTEMREFIFLSTLFMNAFTINILKLICIFQVFSQNTKLFLSSTRRRVIPSKSLPW